MAHVIKKGSIKVPTQPKDYDLQATGLVFKSYDNQIALEFNVEQQNGTPADLLGANLRLLMFIYDEVDGMITKEPIPFITKNLITESFLNGQVVYILPEAMKAYNGMVEAYVYIEYPDGSTSDNLGFTFRMKRSAIDGLAQDKADYFIADFQQLLDGVKQEATDAVNAALTNVDSTIEKANQQINEFVEGATQAIDQTVDEVTEQLQATQTKIDTVSQNVTSAQNNLKAVEDKMNQTNQQIGDLGKLKKMYSNSIDFGDYDYSGNPNLIIPLKASNFYTQSGVTVEDAGNALKVTFTKTDGAAFLESMKNIPALLPNTQYTLSADVTVSEGYTGKLENLRLGYRKSPNGTIILPLTGKEAIVGQKTRISITANSSTATDPSKFDRMYFTINTTSTDPFVGTVLIENIKVERGSTATPYQPNLLDDPYWLGKAPLGENIANKDVQFPITTTEYSVYSKANVEDYKVNQKYVLTMKATKPATQRFIAYLNGGTIKAADLYPVEGLTDTWQGEFTVTQASIDAGALRTLAVYQFPSETKGTVKIDWLKIEKGDTRTPNISQFKYFGEGLKDSNNPNDYSWDITPEYTEKSLNNTVSLTEPQSVEGLKNFEDGLQIAGKEVATVPEDTGWVNLTAINGHSWNKQGQIRRIGKLVMFRGSLKGSTLSTQDFCTIPEGFRPSNPTDNYEYQFLLPPQSSNTLDNGGMAYIRPNGVCGLPSFRGTVNLFLAPIQYYID